MSENESENENNNETMIDPPEAVLAALEQGRELLSGVRGEVGRRIVGQSEILDGLLIALLSGGHVLLEGVPGLGKTLLVRTLAEVLGLDFKRVQCTPDLMPADVLGTTILIDDNEGGRRFEFQSGPIFTHILLADEINRATPKTQSALLEAMQEGTVTVGGESHQLAAPFFMMATQNPIEMEGTFPLPEAQLDRFLLKLQVKMPDLDELEQIIDRTTGTQNEDLRQLLDREQILSLRKAVREVRIPQPVKRWALRLVRATDPTAEEAPEAVRRFVRYGASPRGAQSLVLAGKVHAVLDGRHHVSFDDIRAMAPATLRHRIVLGFEGIAENQSGDTILEAVLGAVDTLEPKLEREAAGA